VSIGFLAGRCAEFYKFVGPCTNVSCIAGIRAREYYAARIFDKITTGGVPCELKPNTSKPIAFEVSSKRRKGFPSETQVKRGDRVVGGKKELIETRSQWSMPLWFWL
jgi:hypothetical protein